MGREISTYYVCIFIYIYERENGKDGRQLPNPAQLTAKSDTQLDSQLEIKLSIICNNSTRQLSQDYMWPMTLFFFNFYLHGQFGM